MDVPQENWQDGKYRENKNAYRTAGNEEKQHGQWKQYGGNFQDDTAYYALTILHIGSGGKRSCDQIENDRKKGYKKCL